jgi:hypothetical protein
MLETLREHAAERLDESGRREVIEVRHARHYLDRARTLARRALPGSDATALLDRDVDNLRAALAHQLEREPDTAARVVLALWRYLVARSMVMEGQQWLETLVERVDRRDVVLRARLLERLGDACLLSGAHVAEGIEWLERALSLYESERDDARAARVHTRLARNLSAYPAAMDIESALAHAVAAGEILDTTDDRHVRAEVRVMHASIALYGRRNRDGLAAATESEVQAERIGAESVRTHALALRGAHLGYCGEVENGFALLERAWLEADRAGDAFISFLAAWMRGFGAWLLADPADAIEWWGRERAQPHTDGSPLHHRTLDGMLCMGNLRLGRLGPARAIGDGEIVNAPELQPQIAMCMGQWDRASRLLAIARDLTLTQGNRNEWTQLTLLYARLRMRLGDRAGAARFATDVLDTLEPDECPYYEIPARALLAGAGVDAAEHLDHCRALLDSHDYRGLAGAVALAETRAAVKDGEEAEAHAAFERARDIFTRYRLRFDEVELLVDWGRALVAWGSVGGTERLEEAGHLLDEIGTPRWSTLRSGGMS